MSPLFLPSIPNSTSGGTMFDLIAPHVCGMISFRSWTREKLLKEIKAKGGESAVTIFTQKEEALKGDIDTRSNQVK